MSPDLIRLTGHLHRDARTAAGVDGSAFLIVEVSQGQRSVCAVARHRMGTGPAAHFAAQNRAYHLRRGARVTVYATGWTVDPANQQLVLCGVSRVEAMDAPAITHEPATEATA